MKIGVLQSASVKKKLSRKAKKSYAKWKEKIHIYRTEGHRSN